MELQNMRTVNVSYIDSTGTRVNLATESGQTDIVSELQVVRFIDSDNSSTTNLGNGGVYTGDWKDTSKYASAIIQVFTNQDSATDGFQIQMSVDGSTATHIHSFTVPANNPDGTHYVFSLTCQYYRIIYTNGTTPQTSFSLCSTLSKYDITHSHTHPINFTITDNHEAQLMRSVLTAKKPNGDYANINATAGGNLKVSVEEFDDAANPVRKDMEGGGKVAVGITAIEATFTGSTTSIIISADIDNTGTLYIGESNVNTSGANAVAFLMAGESITIDYNDSSNAVYVVGSAASQNFWKGALL